MNLGFWSIQLPLPVALAAVATVGYMVGRWRRVNELCPQCKQLRKRAVTLESGLQKSERIAT